jgi:hypothetical protein
MWIERMDNRISSAADNQSKEKKGQRLPGRRGMNEGEREGEGEGKKRETERKRPAHLFLLPTEFPDEFKVPMQPGRDPDPVFGCIGDTKLTKSS